MCVNGVGQVAILNRVVRVGIIRIIISDKGFKGGEKISYMGT